MPATYTIYHNPRCSKSRQTLAMLEEHNITPVIVEYLNNPPDPATLRELVNLLGITPRELMRKKESPYAELGLADPNKSDDELLAAMSSHPILIERPLVVKREPPGSDRAALGRPPENVLDLF